MKIKISKSQWEGIGKKAGWKTAINIGAPGSRARVKQEYPSLIQKLQGAKQNGHPIEIAEEIITDAGISLHSLDAKSLLEVSGWREICDETDTTLKDEEIKQIKKEIAKIVDEFDNNLLRKEIFEQRLKQLIDEMYKIKGTRPNPNVM